MNSILKTMILMAELFQENKEVSEEHSHFVGAVVEDAHNLFNILLHRFNEIVKSLILEASDRVKERSYKISFDFDLL
jgi:hypothetical protein